MSTTLTRWEKFRNVTTAICGGAAVGLAVLAALKACNVDPEARGIWAGSTSFAVSELIAYIYKTA